MQETTFSQTRINKRIFSKENKPKVTKYSMNKRTVINSYQSYFKSYFSIFKLVSLDDNLILWWKFGIQLGIQYF